MSPARVTALSRSFDTRSTHMPSQRAASSDSSSCPNADAGRADGAARSLVGTRSRLSLTWRGEAFDAYDGATSRLVQRVGEAEFTMRRQGDAVDRAADALRATRTAVDGVLMCFDASASALVSRAGSVLVSDVMDRMRDVRRLGESALGAARAEHDKLAAVLAAVAAELREAASADTTAATELAYGRYANNGRTLGETVVAALDGNASPAQFRGAMAQLQQVTDRLREARRRGSEPTAEDKALLSSFYGALGARVFDLPGYVRAKQHTWDASLFGLFGKSEPGFSEADQKT